MNQGLPRTPILLFGAWLSTPDRSCADARAVPLPAISTTSPVVHDLVSALVNLGFRPAIADEAAASAVKRLGEDAGLQSLLKDALMHAGGR